MAVTTPSLNVSRHVVLREERVAGDDPEEDHEAEPEEQRAEPTEGDAQRCAWPACRPSTRSADSLMVVVIGRSPEVDRLCIMGSGG